MKFLILASLAGSLTGFRKPLIQALVSQGLEVHAVAPELLTDKKVVAELSAIGVTWTNYVAHVRGHDHQATADPSSQSHRCDRAPRAARMHRHHYWFSVH